MPFFALSGNIIMISFLLLMLVVPLRHVGIFFGLTGSDQAIKKAGETDSACLVDRGNTLAGADAALFFDQLGDKEEATVLYIDHNRSFAATLFESTRSVVLVKRSSVLSLPFIGLYQPSDSSCVHSRRGPPTVFGIVA